MNCRMVGEGDRSKTRRSFRVTRDHSLRPKWTRSLETQTIKDRPAVHGSLKQRESLTALGKGGFRSQRLSGSRTCRETCPWPKNIGLLVSLFGLVTFFNEYGIRPRGLGYGNLLSFSARPGTFAFGVSFRVRSAPSGPLDLLWCSSLNIAGWLRTPCFPIRIVCASKYAHLIFSQIPANSVG